MKPTKNKVFCIGCHHQKMVFESQTKADNFIKFNSEEIALESGKAPVRSYYCSFCCGWHITSISDEETATEKDKRDEKLWEKIRHYNSGNVKGVRIKGGKGSQNRVDAILSTMLQKPKKTTRYC